MVVYVLDKTFKKQVLIEDFISLIWTERFCKAGDFEFLVLVNKENYQYLQRGNYLMMEDSDRIMVIETRELINDPINGDRLKVSGNSFEFMLDRHICTYGLNTYTTSSLLKISGNAQAIYNSIINTDFITANVLNKNRGVGDLIAIKNEDFTQNIDYNADDIKTIYQLFEEIGEKYNIGYKITYHNDPNLNANQKLWFTSYMGKDRTTNQMVTPARVFSTDYDNLTYAEYIESSENYRNTAMVIGEPIHYRTVFPGKADANAPKIPSIASPYISYYQGTIYDILRDIWEFNFPGYIWYPENNNHEGLDRREIIIDSRDAIKLEDYASDDPDNSTLASRWSDYFERVVAQATKYINEMKTYAKEELESTEYEEETFEASGSIDNLTQWFYGKDYFLGDIVNLLDDYGLAVTVLIDEVIMSYDESGILVTPNFTTLGFNKGGA